MKTLNPKVKNALLKIDFISRYEKLSSHFNTDRTPTENRLIYVDGEEVMEMIRDLGYSPQFDTKEKFYKVEEETIGEFTFGFHIILWEGTVDLVWIVKENGILLLGAPWGTYSRRLIDVNYPEYMVCKDVDKFIAILRYFLEKGSEPGKRQGVKWVVVKRENPYDLAHYSKSV